MLNSRKTAAYGIPKRRPNILFICTDQQRYDSLHCTGATWAKTPNLDRLARGGALFRNCYVQNPVCSPSRASLFTGKYVANHGPLRERGSVARPQRMFTGTLAESGYDCGMIGKQHLHPCDSWQSEPRLDDGYRVFEWAHAPITARSEMTITDGCAGPTPGLFGSISRTRGPTKASLLAIRAKTGTPVDHVPTEAHYSHWVAERAIEFINHPRDEEERFCLLRTSLILTTQSDAAGVSRPDRLGCHSGAQYLRGGTKRKARRAGVVLCKELRRHGAGLQGVYEGQIREIRAQYWAMIALVDHEVGRMLAALDSRD